MGGEPSGHIICLDSAPTGDAIIAALKFLDSIKEMGSEYIGFLYVGLMIKNGNTYLVEFNVRMGDPECQTILPLLKNDLCEIFFNCCTGKLSEKMIKLNDEKSICIVVCSKGYPEDYRKNSEISNLNKLSLKNNEYIFHADWNSSFICNFELYSSSTSISTSLDCQRVIYLISGCRKCKACMIKNKLFE